MNMTFNGRTLYRHPSRGKVKGVCIGVAEFLDIPVRLVRLIAVISMCCGLFVFTLLIYFGLAFLLDEAPYRADTRRQSETAQAMLDKLRAQLSDSEVQLRDIERYVTSETFSVHSRFRRL